MPVGSIAAARRRGGAAADPFFANVSYLKGWETPSGGTWTDDESSYHHVGNPVAPLGGLTTTAVAGTFKFGLRGLEHANANAMVTYPHHASLNFGSGPFTLECWVRFSTLPATGFHMFFAKHDSGTVNQRQWALGVNANSLSLFLSTNGSTTTHTVAASLSWATSGFYFIAADFDGSKYRLYRAAPGDVNATMVASLSAALTLHNSTAAMSVAATLNNGSVNAAGLVGWLDEIRATKGVARYANDAGFAVPTAAFPRS